ncbi:hypothetical protein PAXRUDRAFT_17203 [Paxillus rubicundulus Ve08.2h10]|uniref:Retrovirus-related Pol polyprotein from transposon TNT 1-94-like beta-barrel domain-containing protein n=1 Tax=Paxillus rubicundulus Ve08.2h10 TaxID=930991 RepID=A0A0D0DBB4_9AGAM|nr:hypothetical protein PAXRUDRAFT_17203 [Paxillus rubicundulus Ve08.2h10]
MLNALSGELNAVQTQVASLLSSSTSMHPFMSADIHTRLDTEQQLLDNEKARSTDLALAATTKFNSRGPSLKTCSLGGCPPAVPGSTPSATTNAPSSGPGLRFDSHGRTYILDSVTGGTVFLATTLPIIPPPSLPTVPGTPATAEFAGLAHNSPAFLQNLSGGDQYEFNALLAHLGDLPTSMDWRRHSFPPTAHVSVTAPNQCTSTAINPINEPFFINTGASVHISNTTSNFYNLRPIHPQIVSGVGGSGISAVGIGNIRLNVSCGCHVTLEDVLYIPSAAAVVSSQANSPLTNYMPSRAPPFLPNMPISLSAPPTWKPGTVILVTPITARSTT